MAPDSWRPESSSLIDASGLPIRGQNDLAAVVLELGVCFQSSDHVLLGVGLGSKFKPDIQEFERVHFEDFGEAVDVPAAELLRPAVLPLVDCAPADPDLAGELRLRKP